MNDANSKLGVCAKGHPLLGYTFQHPFVPGKGLFGLYCQTCDPEYEDRDFLLAELLKAVGAMN